MKNALLLLTVMVLTINGYSQSWARAGATWYYTAHYSYIPYPVDGYDKFEKIGDTLVGGKLCDNIYETFHVFNWQLNVWITEHSNTFTYQSNDTVFYWMNNRFWIYANYSAQVGDTWNFARDTASCSDSSYFHVDSLGQRIIGVDTLPVWYLTSHYYTAILPITQVVLTKTIGYDITMFPFANCLIDYIVWGPFRCYFDSSGLSYSVLTPGVPYCDYTIGIIEPTLNKTEISLYPSPNKGTFTIHSPLPLLNSQLLITDVLGRTVYSQTFKNSKATETITIPLSDGIYFWAVVANNKTVAKGKFAVNK